MSPDKMSPPPSTKREKKKLPWGLSSDSLAPGSMRTITDAKIKAFEQGVMNNNKRTRLSKREQEELRRKQEEEATAEVYREFIESFGESKGKVTGTKTFVKEPDKGRIYKPIGAGNALSVARLPNESKRSYVKLGDVSANERSCSEDMLKKRKSNLEVFKEELKRRQEERDRKDLHECSQKKYDHVEVDCHHGSNEDPSTSTNLFVSNIARSLSETDIMHIFGEFGSLASVKIMYPRSDEERSRGSNCGFVAFMKRIDAEKALAALNGSEQGGSKIRVGWGKPISLPTIPPKIMSMQSADRNIDYHDNVRTIAVSCNPSTIQSTGNPFNAQLSPQLQARFNDAKAKGDQVEVEKVTQYNSQSIVLGKLRNFPTRK